MRKPEPGFVYVLANSAMPNHVKVGRTSGTSEVRAQQLSNSTGIPTPFYVVYDEEFEDCCAAEARVHTLLEEQGFRPNPNREFFTAPLKDVIKLVQKVKQEFTAESQNARSIDPQKTLFDLAPDGLSQDSTQKDDSRGPIIHPPPLSTRNLSLAATVPPKKLSTRLEHQCQEDLATELAKYHERYSCPHVDSRYIGKHWRIGELTIANHDGRIQLVGSITNTWHGQSPARVILDIRLSGFQTNVAHVFTAVLEGLDPNATKVFSIPTGRHYETGITMAQVELRFLNQ